MALFADKLGVRERRESRMSPTSDPEQPGEWRCHLPIEGVLEHEQVWGAGNQGSTVDITEFEASTRTPSGDV